jgi:hypothetical protein
MNALQYSGPTPEAPLSPGAPYLIVAPKYNPKSAGVRVMHELCHALNVMGQRAYLTIYPQLIMDKQQASHLCSDLQTPLMTKDLLDEYEAQGLSPIVIYPETMKDPLRAKHVVRYVLNYPGLLGGYSIYPAHEQVYAYSRRLAKAAGVSENHVLFLPISETEIFYPPPEGAARSGSCFYASKYRDFHGGMLLPATANSTEITVNKPNSPTKPEIAELFRRSELFYTYEDTALAIEAALCGCPTVFLPNPFLSEPLGFDDLGMDGFAWGDSPEEIVRAKATVHQFGANYQELTERFWKHLEMFIAATQQSYVPEVASKPFILPTPSLFNTVYFVACYIRQHGVRRFGSKALTLLRKLGWGGFVSNTLKNSASRG